MAHEPIINEVRFTQERGWGDKIVYVHVAFVLCTGEVIQPFGYYPDELSFTESDFKGKTPQEAEKVRMDKDIAYLQS